MTETKTFKKGFFEVDVKVEGEQILFDVEQVAKCLGIVDHKGRSVYVRWNRVNSYLPENSPVVAKGDMIPEPLVYKLAFKASNELAEKFQDWLAVEVVPSIRKHGAYMTPTTIEDMLNNPDLVIGLATKLKEEQQKARELEGKLIEAQPKVDYYDTILSSKSALTISQIAKDYGMSGVRLNRILKEQKVQFKQNGQWMLYSKYTGRNFVKSDSVTYNEGASSRLHTKWTQEGRLFIHKLLDSLGIKPVA